MKKMWKQHIKTKRNCFISIRRENRKWSKTFKVESRRGDKSFRLTSQDMSIDIGGYYYLM